MNRPLTKAEILRRAGYKPRAGRPRQGDEQLGSVSVPAEVAEGLRAMARASGVSVNEIRRRAYDLYLAK